MEMKTLMEETKAKVFQELQQARENTDALFGLLNPGAIYDRPIPLRHRIIFYLGHLEAFDWNQIARRGLDIPGFHPEFDRLFEAGIDPEPGQLRSDQPKDWPSVAEILDYKRRTRETVDSVLENVSSESIVMIVEHRQMHAETLAYMWHNLAYERKARVLEPAPQSPKPVLNSMVDIPAGVAILGQDSDGVFGWDNEFQLHGVAVPAFSISKYKVTNGEYLEFVRTGQNAPHFWVSRGGGWFLRGMFSEFPLPLDWPVYVTQQQAAAYAAWRGGSLPTEAQFHRAAFGTPEQTERMHPWSKNGNAPGNLDFRRWDPVPVNASPGADSAFGVAQLVGNGWEWTSTPFAPFPGFAAASYYPEYSANFFDNQHYVIKGASPRTAARLARRSLRNWFRPEYPYLYASFHVVQS